MSCGLLRRAKEDSGGGWLEEGRMILQRVWILCGGWHVGGKEQKEKKL